MVFGKSSIEGEEAAMACPDEELIDPIRGQRLVFRRTAQETHGALGEVEAFYQPTSVASPAHLHLHQEEYFEVLSGSMTRPFWEHVGARTSRQNQQGRGTKHLTTPLHPRQRPG